MDGATHGERGNRPRIKSGEDRGGACAVHCGTVYVAESISLGYPSYNSQPQPPDFPDRRARRPWMAPLLGGGAIGPGSSPGKIEGGARTAHCGARPHAASFRSARRSFPSIPSVPSILSLPTFPYLPHHRTSPAEEPGPTDTSTRVAWCNGPRIKSGEVQWWGGIGCCGRRGSGRRGRSDMIRHGQVGRAGDSGEVCGLLVGKGSSEGKVLGIAGFWG